MNGLLAKSLVFDDHQKDMIKVLKTVSFVPDKQNILYSASHFKSGNYEANFANFSENAFFCHIRSI
jgi:hypothetical protein